MLFAFFMVLQLWLSAAVSEAAAPCGNVQFSEKLLNRSATHDENFVISPASLQFVLAMVARATRHRTNEQILNHTLLFPSADCKLGQSDYQSLRQYVTSLMNISQIGNNDDFKMKFANYLAVKYSPPIRHTLKEALNRIFKFRMLTGRPRELVDQVNRLVANDTNHLIKNVLEQDALDDVDTLMAIINALYLKAVWFHHFYELDSYSGYSEDSEDKKFFQSLCGNANPVTVNMMRTTNYFLHYERDNLRAIKIPFRDPSIENNDYELNMYIVVPKGCNSLQQILRNAAAQQNLLEKLLTPGVMTRGYYEITMPMFNISTSVDDLKEKLMVMGVTDVFSQSTADFGRMFEDIHSRNYYISQVAQKCVIEVNKDGVEAAAATYAFVAGGRIGGGSYVEPALFSVNRPFLFYITVRHPNEQGPVKQVYETVVFAGQYVKPNNNN